MILTSVVFLIFRLILLRILPPFLNMFFLNETDLRSLRATRRLKEQCLLLVSLNYLNFNLSFGKCTIFSLNKQIFALPGPTWYEVGPRYELD